MHVAEDKLAAFFDGELSPEEYRLVEAHLQTCAQCRQMLDAMALARRGLQMLPRPSLPDTLWDRIQAESTPRIPDRIRFLRRWSPVAVAASVVLLAVAVTILALLSQDRTPVAIPSERDTALPVVSASAPFDLGPYLAALDHVGRLPALPTSYQRRRVSGEEALQSIAQTADMDLSAVPAALELEDASLIEYDGFRMALLVYSHNGSAVLVFAQPRAYPVAFTGFPAEPTVINARRCLSVRCGVYRAYCFSTDEATYTVVGRYGDPTVIQIIETLSGD